MKKIIPEKIIESCRECTAFPDEDNPCPVGLTLYKMGQDLYDIPDNCPLEDYKGNTQIKAD